MKKYALYIICFLMAVATTSCKKEKEEESFLKGQMTDFHGQKAYIDGSNYSCFREGETILVNGRNNCTVSALSNSDRTCTISGAEEASGYYAFYPANLISATDISTGLKLLMFSFCAASSMIALSLLLPRLVLYSITASFTLCGIPVALFRDFSLCSFTKTSPVL